MVRLLFTSELEQDDVPVLSAQIIADPDEASGEPGVPVASVELGESLTFATLDADGLGTRATSARTPAVST